MRRVLTYGNACAVVSTVLRLYWSTSSPCARPSIVNGVAYMKRPAINQSVDLELHRSADCEKLQFEPDESTSILCVYLSHSEAHRPSITSLLTELPSSRRLCSLSGFCSTSQTFPLLLWSPQHTRTHIAQSPHGGTHGCYRSCRSR